MYSKSGYCTFIEIKFYGYKKEKYLMKCILFFQYRRFDHTLKEQKTPEEENLRKGTNKKMKYEKINGKKI